MVVLVSLTSLIFSFKYKPKKHNILRFDNHTIKESIQISTVLVKILIILFRIKLKIRNYGNCFEVERFKMK